MVTQEAVGKSAWTPLIFGMLAILLGGLGGLAVSSVQDPAMVIVLVLAFLALVAVTARVEVGLLVLVFITYTRFSDAMIRYYGMPSIMQSFVPFLLVIILIRWLVYGERPVGWLKTALVVLGYGLVGFASLLYAQSYTNTLGNISFYVRDAVIAIVVVILLHQASVLRRTIWALLIAGIFVGTVSLIQHLTGDFTNVYGGFAQATLMNIVGETSGYRIGGPVGDPNFFGQIMLVLVPLALDRLWNERRPGMRLLAGYALAVSLLTVLFTFSRGAFLGLLFVLLLTFLHQRPKLITVLLLLIVFTVVLQMMPPNYLERMRTLLDFVPGLQQAGPISDVAFEDRASNMRAAVSMFYDHPILGVGLGNFELHYPAYSVAVGIRPSGAQRSAHSLYVEVAAETGLVGLVALAIVLWIMFRNLFQAHNDLAAAGKQQEADMVSALMVAMAGYMLAAAFLHDAFPRYFWLLFGIAMATPNVARHEIVAEHERSRPDAETDGR
jgi:putative inorganic carbon (HCO3(-)) transporter